MRTISRDRILCFALLCLTFSPRFTQAQVVNPLQLQFVDANGNEVRDVHFSLASLVFVGNPAASFAINDLRTVDGGPLQVDALGKIRIAIPDLQLGDLTRFRLIAKHPDFAEFNDWVQVEINQWNRITLSRGVRIAVSAVDASTRAQILDNLFVIAEQKDSSQLADWKSNGKGLLISRPLRTSDTRIRLVEIVDGQAKRFSQPIDVPAAEGERTILNSQPMEAALKIRGRLKAIVPRPIRHGMIAVCISWPTETELMDTAGPVGHWLAHAPVAEDGSFQLSGLPSGDWIQVIASCDGWYNKPASAEVRQWICPSENRWANIEDSILPTAFEFRESLDDVEIEMQPTTSAALRFVDDLGNPVVETNFTAKRSQRFFHSAWDSRDFRSTRSTVAELLAARAAQAYLPEPGNSITGKTDGNGIAHLTGIPGKSFVIQLEGIRFEKGRAWMAIDLQDRDDRPITVKRKPAE